MTERSDTTWRVPAKWFGGFSGLEVAPDGTTLTLITDRGSLVQARLQRTEGTITAVDLQGRIPLKHRNGQNIRGPAADAEGLALSAQGQAYVSFEQRHRVARLDLETGLTEPLAALPGSDHFAKNNGLEALAVHPDGTLYALPEKPPEGADDFPLYCHADASWRICAQLRITDPFLPVGADFDADGTLYLLERAVTPLGFRTRITRLNPRTPDQPAQILLTTGPARYGNLEGLALWRDPGGVLHAITISDDNFASILHTQIVEFVLTE